MKKVNLLILYRISVQASWGLCVKSLDPVIFSLDSHLWCIGNYFFNNVELKVFMLVTFFIEVDTSCLCFAFEVS